MSGPEQEEPTTHDSAVRQIFARRVPHILGAYLLSAWALVEFVNWLVVRYGGNGAWVDALFIALALQAPLVAYLAWFHGRPGRDRWYRAQWTAVALSLVAGTALGALAFQLAPTTGPGSAASVVPTAPNTVAVLPFEDLSEAQDAAYLADGFSTEIGSALSRLTDLRVVSRSSSFQFENQPDDIRKIAAQLGVANVLEGSIRRSGDRIRVNVQLNSAADGFEVWSDSYDRQLADVFAIQDEISVAVVNALRLHVPAGLIGNAADNHSKNLEAYDHYLRGRFFWNERTLEGLQKAEEQFQAAVAIDSTYAAAYAGLSDVYVSYYDYGFLSLDETNAKGKESAEKALALNPRLAEAHTSLAHLDLHYWRWTEGERRFRRALELDPNSAQAHHWYALALTALGHVDQAVDQLRIARNLEPLSTLMNADFGMALLGAKRFDEAVEQELKTLELDPTNRTAMWILGLSYEGMGRYEEAIAQFESTLALNPASINMKSSLAHTYARVNRTEDAERLLAELLSRSEDAEFPAYTIAVVNVGLGNHDEALRWLEKTYEQNSGWVRYLKVDTRLDPLRSDPRFTALIEKIGLP
jgi:serine/threonine-protein kinase